MRASLPAIGSTVFQVLFSHCFHCCLAILLVCRSISLLFLICNLLIILNILLYVSLPFLYVLFEVSVQIFLPTFNWIVCLLIIVLKCSLYISDTSPIKYMCSVFSLHLWLTFVFSYKHNFNILLLSVFQNSVLCREYFIFLFFKCPFDSESWISSIMKTSCIFLHSLKLFPCFCFTCFIFLE